MKKVLVFSSVYILFLHAVSAQESVSKCNDRRKSEMNGISVGAGMDQATIKKLSQISNEWLACVEGKVIPRFKERTIAGEKINAETLAGKILVINFWFVACAPCVAEIPALNKLIAEYKNENVRFLSVTHDERWKVKDFLKNRPFDFDIITDAAYTRDAFGISAFPTTFVIDQNGKIIKAWTGGSTGADASEQAYTRIKPLLDQLLKPAAQ